MNSQNDLTTNNKELYYFFSAMFILISWSLAAGLLLKDRYIGLSLTSLSFCVFAIYIFEVRHSAVYILGSLLRKLKY